MNSNADLYSDIISIAQKTFATGITKDINFRKTQLRALYKLLTDNETQFVESLRKDLKKPRFESMMTEVDFVLNDIRSALNNLHAWTKPKFVSKCFVTLVDDNYIYYEPYGLVLILGAWNYPIQLTLSPLVGAIAAGNTCIVKPSEIAPQTAQLLKKLLPIYLDTKAFHCVLGDGMCAQALVSNPSIDYIFFTGSSQVGAKIYQSASTNLTPCTLEMGGKSPVFIDHASYFKGNKFNEALFQTSVRRILWGKLINTGQTCVAPDYVLCSELLADKFFTVAAKIIQQFYSQSPAKHPDYGRIVNVQHFNRLTSILKQQLDRNQVVFGTQNKVQNVLGGSWHIDENNNYFIEPTIIKCATFYQEPIMQAEIFGPILPIVPVENVSEAIAKINSRDKPLSLYVFSTRDECIQRFRNETSSGSICVNDTVIHLIAEDLPFGGVGKSGIGAYHGKHTFETFSHQKAMLVRGFNPIIEWVAKKRYPPYSENHLRRMLRLLKRRRNPLPTIDYQAVFFFLIGILCFYLCQTFLSRYESNYKMF